MPKLVSPDHILYIVHTRDELKALVRRLGIGYQLAGNLRQLCGWEDVGDGHSGRGLASGWTLLELVRWVKHDCHKYFYPAIGTAH